MGALCLFSIVVAAGAYLLAEEGRNASIEDRTRGSATSTPGGVSSPDDRANHLLQLEGQVDATLSPVPDVPVGTNGWLSTWHNVPGLVEPTPEPTAVVGEVDVPIVEPTRDAPSVLVPPPAPPAGGLEEIICAYDWNCTTAMRIVSCETGGTFNPNVIGAAGERGLFQIHPIHWSKPQCNPDSLFGPAYNTACAYSIWADQGWGPWSCY